MPSFLTAYGITHKHNVTDSAGDGGLPFTPMWPMCLSVRDRELRFRVKANASHTHYVFTCTLSGTGKELCRLPDQRFEVT